MTSADGSAVGEDAADRDAGRDAVGQGTVAIVGTGPNGLAAGVTLARAGLRVELYEAAATIGGGLRGEAYFDSEIRHDVCSAVHPMAAASPFFREFALAERGVELLNPPVSYAHPLDDGRAGIAYHDLETTCDALGPDGGPWRKLMAPLLEHSTGLVDFFMSGQRSVPGDLAAPLLLASRLPAHGTRIADHPGSLVARMLGGFRSDVAPALLTGVAAHAVGKLPTLASGAVAMLLGHLAHGTGWPLPRGGSERIAEVMAEDIRAHGGTFHTSCRITDLRQLGDVGAVLLDTAPSATARTGGGPPSSALRTAVEALPLRSRRGQGRLPGLGTHPLDQSGGGPRGHGPSGRQPCRDRPSGRADRTR